MPIVRYDYNEEEDLEHFQATVAENLTYLSSFYHERWLLAKEARRLVNNYIAWLKKQSERQAKQ